MALCLSAHPNMAFVVVIDWWALYTCTFVLQSFFSNSELEEESLLPSVESMKHCESRKRRLDSSPGLFLSALCFCTLIRRNFDSYVWNKTCKGTGLRHNWCKLMLYIRFGFIFGYLLKLVSNTKIHSWDKRFWTTCSKANLCTQ